MILPFQRECVSSSNGDRTALSRSNRVLAPCDGRKHQAFTVALVELHAQRVRFPDLINDSRPPGEAVEGKRVSLNGLAPKFALGRHCLAKARVKFRRPGSVPQWQVGAAY